MQRLFETENKTRQEDLENLVQDCIFDKFANKTVLVTGATGFIGSEIVLGFLCANRIKNNNTKVIALVRNYPKAENIFKHVLDDKNLEIIVQDIANPFNFKRTTDYIIHCASNTQSADILNFPDITTSVILDGTKNVLNFATLNNVKSTIFLSSLEVYGNIISDNEIKEDTEFRPLDITNPRNSYPLAKRSAEKLCMDYSDEFKTDVKIARLTQIIGAGINYNDNRVFAQFAKSVVEKRDIILHTKGETTRNYCYITDCVSALLNILINGKNKEIYNVSNTETKCSIKKMAEKFAQIGNVQIKYEIKEHNEYLPVIKLCLDNTKLKKLGWKNKINQEEMFQRLIKSFTE